MSHRIGECSSCGATYKLPASFAADRARCKNCGGVVEIGAASPAAPAKASTPPPVPASQPKASRPEPAEPKAKPKREGPSMKERLLAARKAEAEAAAKQAKPAAKKRATNRPAALIPVAKAVPPAKSGTRSSRSATPTRSRRSSSRRGDDDEDENSGSGRRRGRPEKKKKKSLLPAMLGLLALVVVAGGAGWWVMNLQQQEAQKQAGGEVAAADKNATANESGDPLTVEGTPVDVETSGDTQEPESTDEGAASAAPAAGEAQAAAAKPEKVKPEPAKNDPASVDLDALADLAPLAGVSDDRFAELNQLVATMVDPEAGAAGNRAKAKLVEAGKEAFPSILNALKRLDLTEEDQFRSADVCQKALENICNGNNFGWKYMSQEPDSYHYFDKRVIESWFKQWDKVKDDDAAWAKLAKLDKIEASPVDTAAAEDELDDALDELDELDDL